MTKSIDILIREGLVVTESKIQKADVGIREEKIAAVASGLPARDAGRVIVEDGELKVGPGRGEFLSTRITKIKCP